MAVAGYCLAVAHEFVQMCDIVIAADNARFGEPEIRHHSGPPVMITPYIVGLHRAKELLLMGEQVDMMFASLAAALPHIKSGRLRAIAVTAAEPLEVLPGVPTFAQAGFPQFDVRDWAGLVGPAALPPAVVERLNAEVGKALTEAGLEQTFSQMGVYLQTSTVAGFGELVKKEIPKWADVARRSNIKME